MLQSWDADGHVEEWEGTFADEYLEARFRDRRPTVVEDPKGSGSFFWKVDSRSDLYKLGGSPTSKEGEPSKEQRNLARWRGSVESAEFRTARARTELMDAEHITLQVNYPTMLLGWPVAHDPSLNAALTRAYNNWMAGVSSQDPERMKWVSVIDPTDPREAAREIERTKGMGSVGVMVFGVYGQKHLDDPSLEPIWATAAETGLPVAVHPGIATTHLGDTQFHFSVLVGFEHIVASPILDLYPDLKVGFLETSSQWVDFMVWHSTERIETTLQRRNAGTLRGEHYVPKLMPGEHIKAGRLFFGYEVNDAMLPYNVQRWGPDCWLYATDIPHAHRVMDSTGYLLQREDLSPEAKRKLLVDNTAVFYGLPLPRAG
jgi:predicted TIM-barrel fold metal-dependent hydrolase